MITAITLKRFKSHEYTEIRFSKGTNVIVGPMGSGKSTVLEAICFAFYGTTPAIKNRRIKTEDLVMKSPTKYEDASVEVWFDVENRHYSVERRISTKGTGEAHLRLDGKIIEAAPQRVTEAIARTLKVDYDLFVRAIYSEQNRMDQFLNLNKAERKKQADELLGIDEFEAVRSSATTLANRLKTAKTQTETLAKGIDSEKIKAGIKECETTIAECEAQLAQLAASKSKLEEKARELRKAILLLEDAEKNYNALKTQCDSTIAIRETVAAKLASLDKPDGGTTLNQAAAEKERLAREIQSAKLKLGEGTRLATELTRLNAKISAIEEELARANAKDPESAGNDFENARSEWEALSEALRENEKELAAINQELAIARAEWANHAKAMAESEVAATTVAELESQLARLKNPEVNVAESKVASLEWRIKTAEDALKLLEEHEAACPVCESPLTVEKSADLRTRRTAETKNYAQELTTARNALAEARATTERIEALNRKLAAAQERHKIAAEAAAREGKAGREQELEHKAKLQSERTEQCRTAEAKAKERENAARTAFEQASRAKERTAELDKLKEEAEKVGERITTLNAPTPEELEALHAGLDKANSEYEYLASAKQLEEISAKEQQLRESLVSASFTPGELAAKRTEEMELRSRLAAESERSKGLERTLTDKKAIMTLEKQNLDAATKHEERAALLQRKIEWTAKYANALAETQAALRNDLVAAINAALSEFWPQIYPYRDYSNARITVTEDDYEMEVEGPGGWVPADSLSGGERSCAALAMRAALATVLAPGLNWLVLDEPTHNLDANAVQLFCRTIKEQMPQIIGQIFVITHDEALKEGASHKIYKIERDKDKGDKSSVEELDA